ncbi:F0F1 ATP synthase subunit gamma [Clostridium bovifaecis]|uniref:ATP synthase gamma chain n=1 Tax=Clostridium bovifaecis TaxID=2184719 RepID=A0A6I6EVG4_9CLOT|nr:F0F1 ATP synthase subunit gamma [Clostridium bovifaecis]
MAGAGLIAIKRRIKSINNTKKITKAIGLVATSKLRKARESLSLNNDYYNSFREVMNTVLSDSEVDKNIYFTRNDSNKKLYIALTSDTGLCGGFNGNVVSKTLEYVLKDKENSLLIIVGQKGRVYFRRFNIESVAEYVEIPDLPTIKEAKTILDKALELYSRGEVGEVNVIYTEFVSAVKQEAKLKKLLPIDKDSIGVSHENDENALIEFEPEKGKILGNISELYLKQTILNLMLNSKTSEQSSRMTAMDGATKNANDLLDKLNLKYNRIRQSTITQEISEIVGGAEAQR